MNAKSRHRQRRRLKKSLDIICSKLPSFRLERVQKTWGLRQQIVQAYLENRDKGSRHTWMHFSPFHVY